MEKYIHQNQIGTAKIKITDSHLHIQQPDEITSKLHWVAFDNKEAKQLLEYLNSIYA